MGGQKGGEGGKKPCRDFLAADHIYFMAPHSFSCAAWATNPPTSLTLARCHCKSQESNLIKLEI